MMNDLFRAYLKRLVKRPFYSLYERRLEQRAHDWERPKHIGIVLDGNRRFARMEGLGSVVDGHARGADKLQELLNWCYEYDIPYITIWIFSLDNFNRDPKEVDGLFRLIESRTKTLVDDPELHEKQVRLRYIGRLGMLPESLQHTIADAEARTAHYKSRVLNVAIAYGGREEITDAMGQHLRACQAKGLSMDEVQASLEPEDLEPYLYTSGLPDPDLLIRTSGEVRLSGFLLWQSAYAEYYFCDVFWPDFRKIDFLRALRSYALRHRRFGL